MPVQQIISTPIVVTVPDTTIKVVSLAQQGLTGAQGIQGIKGLTGDQGLPGINGTNGIIGANGLSAYEVAVNNGFVGTEADWLNHISTAAADWNYLLNKPPLSVVYPFTNSNAISINHQMQQYPSVRVVDTGGNEWIPQTINFPSINDVFIGFSTSLSGTVYLS